MNNDRYQQTVKVNTEKEIQQQFNIPITFIWYGPEVPQDYLIKMSNLPYPVQFFKNPPIARNFKRDLKYIEKADYYRLEYIYQNGGIYSDFDNQIDYKCMAQVLKVYKTSEKVIFWWQPKRNAESRNVVPNSFIYAPKAKMEAMGSILSKIDQNNRDLKFAGMQYLAQFANKQLIQVKELYNCIKHQYDFSWVKQSGKTPGSRGDKQQLANKKRKKEQIIAELDKFKRDNVELNREYGILMEKYNQTEEKLMKEYKKHYVSEGKAEKKQLIDSVVAKPQNSKDLLIQNNKLTSMSSPDVVKSKEINRQDNYLQQNTIAQKQSVQERISPQQAKEQRTTVPLKYSRGFSGTPLQNPYQPPALQTPVYAGQSMRPVNPKNLVNQININLRTSSQKMDDDIRLVLVFTVIALVLLFMVAFIWTKFKKYRRYAELSLQLNLNIGSDWIIRNTSKKQFEQKGKHEMGSGKGNSLTSLNQQNERLDVKQ